MESLPEINLNLNTAKDTAKKTATQATSTLKAAGSLVAKKAERTKLVTVTLPRAYAELGKSVYKAASHREEFAQLFQSVDTLLAERKRIAEEGKTRPAGTTVTDKAKKIAADAADMAKTKAVDLQTFQAFAKLGEAVFQQYGHPAGAAETVEPIAKAIARRDALDREVAAINSSAKGKWITPKRIVWAAGILVALGVLGNLADDKADTSTTKPGRTTVTKQKSNKEDAAPLVSADELGEPDQDDWRSRALHNDVKKSRESLERNAAVAKEAQASLDAGPKPGEESDFNNWEKEWLRRIDEYGQAQKQYEEAVNAYAVYQKERAKEKQAAAVAAKEAEKSRKQQEKDEEAARNRVAAKKKSRKAPKMNPPKDPRGLEEYKEGWEDGVTLGFQWVDRIEQAAKGKSVEQYVKEHPLAKADAQEKMQYLTNDVLARVDQMTKTIQNLRNRGITIDLDHPEAAAAHSRWTFARGKQDGYMAVVIPMLSP